MNSHEKVTVAWRRVHADHPEVHRITQPTRIERMKHRDFMKFVRQACMLSKSPSVLEAGCGNGRDSVFFRYIGCHCTAVDLDQIPLNKLKTAKAQVINGPDGSPLDLKITLADIFKLSYADNTFDYVFNSGIIEHYDEPTRLGTRTIAILRKRTVL